MRMIFPKKSSVFVFLLVVASFVAGALFTALRVSETGQHENISASETVERSFQVADNGVERVLQKFSDEDLTDLTALASAVNGSCVDGYVFGSSTSGTFSVALYDGSDARIADCSDADWHNKAVSVRSEGYSDGTSHIVETAEAQAIGNKSCRQVGPIGSSSWTCGTNEYVQMIMANGTMATQMYVMCCQF